MSILCLAVLQASDRNTEKKMRQVMAIRWNV